MKQLVLGLGNSVLTDDAVGILIAEEIEKALPDGSDIDVWTSSHGGLKLIEAMVGYDRVFLIDAVRHKGGTAGHVSRMSPDELRRQAPIPHTTSARNTDVLGALQLGERYGLPMPAEIIIYLIDAAEVAAFGEHPTEQVAAAIPRVTTSILEELDIRTP